MPSRRARQVAIIGSRITGSGFVLRTHFLELASSLRLGGGAGFDDGDHIVAQTMGAVGQNP